jgi:uncharacterized metal-binding protein YceD (DUF177 family)
MVKKRYVIQLAGLNFGSHTFEFRVDNSFFESLDFSEISEANVDVEVEVLKQNNVTTLSFNLQGSVSVPCDRCLKVFDFPVKSEEKIFLKNGNVEETNETLLVMPEGETEVDLSQVLYEFISLSVPSRRVPCEIDKKKFKCDKVMLQKLGEISLEEEPQVENPLWEELKKIKFNKP